MRVRMKSPAKKVVFIIPGFRQSPASTAYKKLAKILKNEGYHPILVKIPWKNSTISENAEFFMKRFKKTEAAKKYILGFSYGAMIAFLVSTKVRTSGLILCSLSPYFKEDISSIKTRGTSILMRQRYDDFSKLHCSTLSKKIKTKQVVMLYGTLEARSLIRRVTDTFGKIEGKNKKLISIKKTDHNIGDKKYLQVIHATTQTLT